MKPFDKGTSIDLFEDVTPAASPKNFSEHEEYVLNKPIYDELQINLLNSKT
jgi:hypothetical protein